MIDQQRLVTLQFFVPSNKQIDFQLSKTLNHQEEFHFSLMYSSSLQKLPSVEKQLNHNKNMLKNFKIHRPKSSLNNKRMKEQEVYLKPYGYKIMTKNKKNQLQNQYNLESNSKNQTKKNHYFKKRSSISNRNVKTSKTQRKPTNFQAQKILQVFRIGPKIIKNNYNKIQAIELEKFELKQLKKKQKHFRVENRQIKRTKIL